MEVAKLTEMVISLQAQVNALQQLAFNKKSERSATGQSKKKANKNNPPHPGRKPFPPHLERRTVIHDLTEEEKVCKHCQSQLTKIGEITSEQLELVPAILRVIKHIRCKYACKNCHHCLKLAPLPAQPFEKSIATASLAADIISNKYTYHLPLHRQEKWYGDHGCSIRKSTLCGIVMSSASLLAPIVEAMAKETFSRDHLFSDDTSTRVFIEIKETGKKKLKKGTLWVITCKESTHSPPCTIYHTYSHSRGGVIADLLRNGGFTGYLQKDGTSKYNKAKRDCGFIDVGCWGHGRRPYVPIVRSSKKKGLAHQILRLIDSLYSVEHFCTDQKLSPEERYKVRQEQSKPILKAIKKLVDENKEKILPKSPLGKAMAYTLNHWDSLNTYLLDGRLEIDNNRSERALRGPVLGRKNYLFFGSEEGAEAAEILYSLADTAKQNNVNFREYLTDVLERISTHPNTRISELLPYNWQKLYSKEALSQQAASQKLVA